MVRQLRRTAGFIVSSGDTLLHVDPGPGALVYLNQHRYRPERLSGILVSHAHLDHANDAAALVEGMTGGGKRKRGVFVGSRYVVEGGDDFSPALSPYHASMPERLLVAEPGESVDVGGIHVTFTRTWHDEPTGVGFIFDDGRVRVAYLSDTGYVGEVAEILARERPHAVIFNLIIDVDENVPHTTLYAVRKFLEAYVPPLVLLQHFGARITLAHRENAIARSLSEEFGARVIALRDGQEVDVSPARQATLEGWEHEG